MRAIDTNVLVRLITGDKAAQAGLAASFVEKGAWVSLLALADAIWVLRSVYRLDAADLAAAVEMLLNHKDLALQDSDVVEAALELFRSRPALGFFRLPVAAARSQGGASANWYLRPYSGENRGNTEAVGVLTWAAQPTTRRA